MPSMEECLDILVGFSVSLSLTLFIFRAFFFSGGFAFFGEFGTNLGRTDYATSLWDPLNQRPLLPNHMIVDSWSNMLTPELGQRIPLMLSFTLVGASMFFSSYKLLRSRFDRVATFLGALFAMTFSMINPFTVTRIPHGKMLFFYALVPTLFYLLHISFSKLERMKKVAILRNSVMTALVLFFMSISIRLPFLLPLLISVLIIHAKQILRSLKNFFVYVLSTSTIFVAASSIWILPTFAASGNLPSPSIYILTKQVIDLLSRHASILNVLTMNSEWHGGARALLIPSDPTLEFARYVCLGLIPILAFLPLLIAWKRKDVLTLALMALISVFLAKGANPPFSNFYYWFVFDTPVVSSFGWIFRGSGKWSFLAVTPAMILLSSFTVGFLAERIRNLNLDMKSKNILTAMLFSVLLIIPLLSGFPLLSGDVNGEMSTQEIPTNYLNAYEWLEKQNGESSALWYPSVPKWGAVGSSIKYDHYWNYLDEKAFENGLVNPARLLAPWGTRYIIVRGDELEETETSRILSFLESQEGIRSSKNFTDIYIFENSEHTDQVSITSQNIWVSGGIDKFSTVLGSKTFQDKTSVLFSDYLDLKHARAQSRFDTFLLDNLDLLYNVLRTRGDCLVITPFQHVRDYNPDQVWSRAATTDPIHGPWHSYIEDFGIDNWQFDYGKGLVFTRSSWLISKSSVPQQSDLIVSWEFENSDSIESWKNENPEVQFGALQVLEWEDGNLKAELYNSTWGWKTIKSPLIEVATWHVYRFSLMVKGQDAQSVHVKVVEYDSNRTVIHAERLSGIGTGTFNWQRTIADYSPKKEETKYIQLQVWHGSETDKPLPNVIWLDEIKIYNMSRYTQPIRLEIPFNIETENDYKVIIRYFANSEGGKIDVYVDKEHFGLMTKNQLNQFVWEQVQTLNLTKGEHKLILENVQGLNAVNMFVFVPVEEYEKAIGEIQTLLKDKVIFYVFEAESDLYHEETQISQEFVHEASNGELVVLKEGSKVWCDVEVLIEGEYRLAANLKGQTDVKIANQTFILSSESLTFVYTDTIYLKTGKHNMEIASGTEETCLDVIWLFSIENDNETLEEIFRPKEVSAQIVNYQKIDPTKYVLEVNATNPFMLSFAEAYDSLWVARINDNEYKPIPLYSVTNGFRIEQTGRLQIIIEYKPQKWFYIGSAISITTLLLSITCLIYLNLIEKRA